jgi:hypothetical protein
MKVFLSWSGDMSQQITREIYDWLPLILQNVKLYMTPSDIEKGARWSPEMTQELETCNFGIICLTKDNLASLWIAFEAGALSKALTARVATFLFGIGHADVPQPLAQFQGTLFEKSDVRKLVGDINEACTVEERRDDRNLERLFDMTWPDFEGKIKLILESDQAVAPPTSQTQEAKVDTALKMLSELLVLVRQQFVEYPSAPAAAWMVASRRRAQRRDTPLPLRATADDSSPARMISMPFYQVRSTTDPNLVYHCGQQPDCEAGITHFNKEYGPTVGKTFTTLPTGTPCADYVLVELERRGGGSDVGLDDVRSIPLFER